MLVKSPHRLPMLNAVKVPQGVDEAEVRSKLLDEHAIEIGAGLGPLAGKIWRIGLMGESSRREHVLLLLRCLETVLADLGVDATLGRGQEAAQAVFQ